MHRRSGGETPTLPSASGATAAMQAQPSWMLVAGASKALPTHHGSSVGGMVKRIAAPKSVAGARVVGELMQSGGGGSLSALPAGSLQSSSATSARVPNGPLTAG